VRILHLVGRSHRRGAELVAIELAEALEVHGHESRILAVGPGHEGGTDPAIPVLTGFVRQHPGALVVAGWRLRRELRATPVDVVLAHGGSPLQVAVLASVPRRRPIVYQLIMGMPLDARGRLWHRWWGWLLGRCAAVVSLTDALTAEVRGLGYAGPVRLVPNARRAERFHAVDRVAAAAALRGELGLEPDAPVVGFVGHLVDQKRPDVAVEVLADLRRRGVPAHLVVVGSGPNEAALRARIDQLGLADHVTLAGHRSDVESVLGGIDLLVLTSDDEGMPGVVIEAQMAGCPVVTFPVGGVAEVLEHGTTGVVLADHDPGAMAEAVATLLGDPDERSRMVAAARERSERFTMARAAVAYHEVLTAVAPRPGR
jgi:glycosyltransferase involved in cell wall biosynthesis